MMLLTVRGRQTGLPRTNPVDVFENDGRYWLVSTHGVGDSNWVRNLRAAGAGTLARGKRTISFTAAELSATDASEVLRNVLGPRLDRRLAGFVLRRTLQLRSHASPDAFGAAVRLHPVFELTLSSRTD
jgi:deazaflavin-dependent oxidoreductase (nitroreductase family)